MGMCLYGESVRERRPLLALFSLKKKELATPLSLTQISLFVSLPLTRTHQKNRDGFSLAAAVAFEDGRAGVGLLVRRGVCVCLAGGTRARRTM